MPNAKCIEMSKPAIIFSSNRLNVEFVHRYLLIRSEMKVLARFTQGKWADLSIQENNGAANEVPEMLRRAFVDFFRSENLVVLTGLGTSLCIQGSDGQSLAPTMWDLWERIKERVTAPVLEKVCKHVNHPKDNEGSLKDFVPDIELLLSKCIVAQEFKKQEFVQDFIKVAETTIVELCDFISKGAQLDIHEEFLRRIARRPTRLPRTKIFTTNYDLAFETAASRLQFVAVDGFSHTLPQEFDSSYFAFDLVRRDEDGSAPNYIPNVFQLYKLHGSVDWHRDKTRVVKSTSPLDPVLIYPRYSKFELSYESPFLDMIARFQSSLRQQKTSLLIIGFGFNDKHLTQPILSAIRSNVGLRTMVVSPSLENSGNSAVESMESLIKNGDGRLALFAGKFQDCIDYLPDLVSESEEEQHKNRVKGRL